MSCNRSAACSTTERLERGHQSNRWKYEGGSTELFLLCSPDAGVFMDNLGKGNLGMSRGMLVERRRRWNLADRALMV